MSEPMNEELDFNVGEEEQEATIEMNEDGSDAKLSAEEAPVVEEQKKAGPAEEDLDDYSGKVKKRIDKLTARLRETQRREEAALDYARNVRDQNEQLEQRYQKTDTERLQEAQGRVARRATRSDLHMQVAPTRWDPDHPAALGNADA